MGGKQSKQTPSTPPPTADAEANTTQAAASNTSSNDEPDVMAMTGAFLTSEQRLDYAATSNRHRDALFGSPEQRKLKITHKLLRAVANGMESATVNINPATGKLFKEDQDRLVTEASKAKLKESRRHNEVLTKEDQDAADLIERRIFFAEDLLKKSPEFLLERVHLKDWAGRTFKGRLTEAHPEGEGITAFEYALWAKDFQMLEMMIACIPETAEGDRIRAGLFEQYEQVTRAGGGLTYELTYDKPTLDAAGVWRTTSVTEFHHTENHFDLSPLIDAYDKYIQQFKSRTDSSNNSFWVKIIGTQQRLLPIHILQRYCDPDTPFDPVLPFTDVFKRTTQFYNQRQCRWASLLSSSLSTDFSLFRWCMRRRAVGAVGAIFALGGDPFPLLAPHERPQCIPHNRSVATYQAERGA